MTNSDQRVRRTSRTAGTPRRRSSQSLGRFLLFAAACASAAAHAARGANDAAATTRPAGVASSRTFDFTYAGTISGLEPGREARGWIPVAPSNADQAVTIVGGRVPTSAVEWTLHTSPEFPGAGRAEDRNTMIYARVPADAEGKVGFSLTYRVTRREVGAEAAAPGADARPFLRPDALVPIGGRPTAVLLGGATTLPSDPLRLARLLYDAVDDHMQYRKDKPGYGRGDAVWACDSDAGNCTDFHSLFMSLARTQQLPAQFVIGFPLPEKRGKGDVAGYHCWSKFLADGNWVPVDISEANKHPAMRDYYFGHLTPDRVEFSRGRDLTLDPKQSGPPLNFFVYPYVEVDGKPLSVDHIKTQFGFEDVEGGK